LKINLFTPQPIIITLTLILLVTVHSPLFAKCTPENSVKPENAIRFSVHDSSEFETLYESPKTISFQVFEKTVKGESRLFAKGDYHAVYPIKMKYIQRIMENIDGQENFQKSIAESKVICSDTNTQSAYYKQKLKTQFGFLFFKAQYHNIINLYVPKNQDKDTYGMWFTLEKSLDNKMMQSRGSWFLKEVEVNGKACTYIRYFLYNGFEEETFGLRGALKNFSEGEVKKTLDNIYSASNKLKKNGNRF